MDQEECRYYQLHILQYIDRSTEPDELMLMRSTYTRKKYYGSSNLNFLALSSTHRDKNEVVVNDFKLIEKRRDYLKNDAISAEKDEINDGKDALIDGNCCDTEHNNCHQIDDTS
ncbi:hypothetical protein LOAG_13369 [Loa loa]|uniref:Uncharacterized protein n=1 Tax=Loa loa TaxID=7209 RepID=A0A1S0TJL2_LOALO|nr:hypothetical protein LOAG_13369 [Loa loa]EFO15141.1 hypothetical protein LOAG_13369 [Loa loa]